MKRWIIPVLAALLFIGAAPPVFKVRHSLDRAVTNEREAVARYEAFAKKADEEGYAGAAALFRAAARAEKVHHDRFAAALKARGLDVPESPLPELVIASTAENLRASASAEAAERDSTYREAIAAAQEAKDEELLAMFDQTRDTEVEHANLFNTAARQLDSMKGEKTYYVCEHCGYTTDVKLPLCALCRDKHHPDEVH